jgi:hypothetical protein
MLKWKELKFTHQTQEGGPSKWISAFFTSATIIFPQIVLFPADCIISRRFSQIFPQIDADFCIPAVDKYLTSREICSKICVNLRENPRLSAGKSAKICGKICENLRETIQ